MVSNGEFEDYIIGGVTSSNDGDVSGFHPSTNRWEDGWLFKINSSGKMLWQRALGGSSWDNIASIMHTTDKGILLMASTSSSDGDISEHHGGEWVFSPWIVKMNATGTIEWEHNYNIPADPYQHGDDYGAMIIPTSDNGYIFAAAVNTNGGDVTGHHGATGTSTKDFWVVKLKPETSDVKPLSSSTDNISISPNPTQGIGKINYALISPATIRIEVYNIMGERVELLSNTYEQSGEHSFSFDLSDLASGKYFLRFENGGDSRIVPFDVVH